jgi:hypothetical protein
MAFFATFWLLFWNTLSEKNTRELGGIQTNKTFLRDTKGLS